MVQRLFLSPLFQKPRVIGSPLLALPDHKGGLGKGDDMVRMPGCEAKCMELPEYGDSNRRSNHCRHSRGRPEGDQVHHHLGALGDMARTEQLHFSCKKGARE